jgi:hypothetical protein
MVSDGAGLERRNPAGAPSRFSWRVRTLDAEHIVNRIGKNKRAWRISGKVKKGGAGGEVSLQY